ncbi:MAG: hypothetical protein KF770_31900 [Anaerolineae bacterium]|nr:hypothetical protein [Anaerolineae bacterium]
MAQNPLKVLLVADELSYIQQIRRLLAEADAARKQPPAYEVLHSDQLSTAVTYLETITFDLILLVVGAADGPARLAAIQENSGDTPVIVVGEMADDGRWAIRQGAQDFLARPLLTPPLLERAINLALARQQMGGDTAHYRQQAENMREKAAELEVRNIALDEFAHTMAHQVQGLLGQMVGYASYLEMQYGRTLDEEFATVVSRIVQSGHKMNNVISELLLLASIRGSDVILEPLNMQRVVAEAFKRLRYQIEQSQVEIRLPDSWPVALGHGPWIEEAWVNYMSNGIKYGGTRPCLELGSNPLPNGMVRFWVKDNGIGIPEIDQELLFKPHTRLGPKQVRGEGLGLSIVRRVVAKCGGKVGVESHVGYGSLFWFSLPLADQTTES